MSEYKIKKTQPLSRFIKESSETFSDMPGDIYKFCERLYNELSDNYSTKEYIETVKKLFEEDHLWEGVLQTDIFNIINYIGKYRDHLHEQYIQFYVHTMLPYSILINKKLKLIFPLNRMYRNLGNCSDDYIKYPNNIDLEMYLYDTLTDCDPLDEQGYVVYLERTTDLFKKLIDKGYTFKMNF